MVGKFQKKSVKLTVTTAQAVILNRVNELDDAGVGADEDGGGEQKKGMRRGVTFADVKTATQLDDRQCKVLLHSLSCIKKRKVLSKEPASSRVQKSDLWFFNDAFETKLKQLTLCKATEASIAPATTKVRVCDVCAYFVGHS